MFRQNYFSSKLIVGGATICGRTGKGAEAGRYGADYAPRGEYAFTAAFEKMCRNARSYIYLEDQFMFYEEALKAVADALPHVDAVVIVTDDAASFTATVAGVDVTVASQMRYDHQKVALDQLMKDPELAKKVHV